MDFLIIYTIGFFLIYSRAIAYFGREGLMLQGSLQSDIASVLSSLSIAAIWPVFGIVRSTKGGTL